MTRERRELRGVGLPLLHIERAVELSASALMGHVADLSEDRSFRTPNSIVFSSDCPRDSGITVGVASIKLVPIIEGHWPH